MEEALQMNLSSVLSDAVDNQAINGSGTGDGTLNGLLNRLANPSNPSSGQETFARYVAAVGSHVDGLFATDLAGVRMLVGPQTYRHAVIRFSCKRKRDDGRIFFDGSYRRPSRVAADRGS